MTIIARTFPDYASALLATYEEEISGEGYFAGLAGQLSGRPREALLLIARMERATAKVLRPLIERHGLATADPAALMARGAAAAEGQRGITWESLVRRMADEYPAYMDELEQLARLAPDEDQAAIAIAAEHELALIELGRREVAGDPRSLEPIERFVAKHGGGG